MSTFTTPLEIRENGDGTFTLLKEFVYYLNHPDGEFVRVPSGYKTDFASIPKVFRPILPPYHQDYGKAAVVHDYLCQIGVIRSPSGLIRVAPRAEADLIFYQASTVLGSPLWKRATMWAALRLYAIVARKS